jgi:hypothetical protein
MLNDTPPSGPWTGYYLYGHGGPKHGMRLHLMFTTEGTIEGEGVDDVGAFVIAGRFHHITSEANWSKAYAGRHTVEYSGVYCQRSICGDWTLRGITGGFWIWPHALAQSEFAEGQADVEQPLEAM